MKKKQEDTSISMPKIRKAGSQIYVGFGASKEGDFLSKIFGPVSICETKAQITHRKGGEPNVSIRYTVNSLGAEYDESDCFDTLEEATAHAKEEVANYLRKVTSA